MRNATTQPGKAPQRRGLAGAALALFTFATWAPAIHGEGAQDRFWQHKQWRSVATENGLGELQCTVLTGGDGDNRFSVAIDMDGNFQIEFREQLVRGYPSALHADDEILFTIEGAAPMTYEDVTVFDEQDEYGDRVLRAAIPSGYAADITGMMRKGTNLTVQRINPTTRQRELIQRFPLAGFTANLLKIGEWCAFDPNDIFGP